MSIQRLEAAAFVTQRQYSFKPLDFTRSPPPCVYLNWAWRLDPTLQRKGSGDTSPDPWPYSRNWEQPVLNCRAETSQTTLLKWYYKIHSPPQTNLSFTNTITTWEHCPWSIQCSMAWYDWSRRWYWMPQSHTQLSFGLCVIRNVLSLQLRYTVLWGLAVVRWL